MQTLEIILKESSDPAQFARAYLDYLSGLLRRLDSQSIAAFIGELESARLKGNTVFVVGNGGSAATASHMANDFSVGAHPRDGSPPFRVLALTDNVAAMTAIGNDAGYENLFVYQLRVHYRPGDRLIAISASGNSPNIAEAARWVKKQGGRVIGLVGFDGGELKRLSDLLIHVETPKGEYGPVEDIHMIMDHLVYAWLKAKAGFSKE
ncbi:MAG: SIS domain-containing protein [Nitrospirae bacterium]|nr:MAG: SIS domain-containing protein [Nitrospirota bacterium]